MKASMTGTVETTGAHNRQSTGTDAHKQTAKQEKTKMYIINHATEQQFYDTIYAMVERGLHFTADVDKLTITLRGGY